MKRLMSLLSLAFVLTTSAVAADLPSSFVSMTKQTKGPFGLNVLQGTTERVIIRNGANRAPHGFLFQAAYRTELAKALANENGFYIGNLFTTNYYELMGEYVYNNAYGDHEVDHAALAANSSAAITKAALMVRNWVLEKQYIELLPASRLALSFKARGISSYENEVTFAKYFFNFYLGAITDEFQYLPAFILAGQSPLSDSSALARARELVAKAYDDVVIIKGSADPMTRSLYQIRNSIHNQLTPAVVTAIDHFLASYPRYRTLGQVVPADPDAPANPDGTPAGPVVVAGSRKDMDVVRATLADYYAYNAAKVSAAALKAGVPSVKTAADQIVRAGVTPATLLALSAAAADVRAQLKAGGSVAFDKRAETLGLLTNVSRYIRKEVSRLAAVNSPAVVEALVNTIYIEGFLIPDNWQYFKSQAATSTDLAKTLSDVIDVASQGTLVEAFAGSLDQWKSIEPKMSYFTDNTIKSSSLSTAAAVVEKLSHP